MLVTPLARSVRGALLALAALFALATVGAAQSGGAAPPGEEPPLSAFVDSAALVRAVAALPAPELPPGVRPIFSVSFDSTGVVREVEAEPYPLPASYAEAVAAAIRAHLKPQAPSRRPLQTYLRVVAGAEPLVDRPELRIVPPVLGNRSVVARRMEQAVESFVGRRGSLAQAWYQGELKFRVLEDGSVDTLSVEVSRSTGEAELDREAVAVAGVARFRPATVEGLAARVWVTLPLTFTMPREAVAASVPAVVDSAALARALAGLSVPEPPSGVRPLFRVGYDSTGAVADVEPVFDQIPAEYAGPVAAAIRASAKPQAPPAPGRRVLDAHLLVVAGPEPAVSRPAVTEERPVLANEREVDRMVREAKRRFGRRPDRLMVIAGVGLRVRADGTVDPESIRLFMSSGEPELDREALGIAARMRFQPAVVDGIPVGMRTWESVYFWLPGQ